MPLEDKFVIGGLAALTLGCTASLLWLSSSVYASSKLYCDGSLALWLVCLCSLLCGATILVACFVVRKSFRLAFCFFLIKVLALVGIVVVLSLVYVTYFDSSGDTPYKKWVYRVGEDWVNCMSKSNLCQNGNNEILKACCEKPWGCEGGSGTIPLYCFPWILQETDGMCYNCEACKSAVFQKVVAKWKTLKSWWMIALTLCGLTTIVLELVYHAWYRLKVLREQQQEVVRQQHEQQLIELRNLDRERDSRSADRGPYES